MKRRADQDCLIQTLMLIRLKIISEGKQPDKGIETEKNMYELSTIFKYTETIQENNQKFYEFISELEKENFTYEFSPKSSDDITGNALIKLRKNIEQSKSEELNRKKIDEQLNWISRGAAKFAEIIRENSENFDELTYSTISELVKYIDAVQGGLFIINEDDDKQKYIELSGCYAYNRRRILEKRIEYGVGLVSRCILERETIYMTKVPQNYLTITSGLGEENPGTLLIVPLIFHEEVFGAIELASFKEFEDFKIQLIEQIAETIASAVSMVKINIRTAELLRESKIKSEQAASQEEEIRQNIEEMQAITDELTKKLFMNEQLLTGIKEIANYVEFDNQGRIIDISDRYLKNIDKEKKDVIGKIQGSFNMDESIVNSFNLFWDDLRKGKIMVFQQIININGNMKSIFSRYYPVKNSEGTVVKVIGIAEIITKE